MQGEKSLNWAITVCTFCAVVFHAGFRYNGTATGRHDNRGISPWRLKVWRQNLLSLMIKELEKQMTDSDKDRTAFLTEQRTSGTLDQTDDVGTVQTGK
ncbi:hypothetical protein BaRGS_00039959, partial [Batillaria attramentaria]